MPPSVLRVVVALLALSAVVRAQEFLTLTRYDADHAVRHIIPVKEDGSFEWLDVAYVAPLRQPDDAYPCGTHFLGSVSRSKGSDTVEITFSLTVRTLESWHEAEGKLLPTFRTKTASVTITAHPGIASDPIVMARSVVTTRDATVVEPPLSYTIMLTDSLPAYAVTSLR